MKDYLAIIKQQSKRPLSERKQKQVGKAIAGDVKEEHKNFLKTLFALLDSGEINPDDPHSFLKSEIYDNLNEKWQDKIDLSLANITDQVILIQKTRASAGSNDSIHLQTQVEQLWQMKQRIEEHHDAFKF